MDPHRLFIFAVLGSSSVSEDSPEGVKAMRVGRLIADRGQVLMTGGCPGLPHAAIRGALEAGGMTIAISPAANREAHVSLYDYPLDAAIHVFTGMGTKGRNVTLVRSADACIFVGGGMGTLNEFTIAFDELGPAHAIGILKGSGGFSGDMARLASLVGRPPKALLVEESNPDTLVDLLLTHCRNGAVRPTDRTLLDEIITN
ncbi:MAG: LOG family protein [Desulfomonile sp.]|nr:LOG family protein [Desulfomonile sp.]